MNTLSTKQQIGKRIAELRKNKGLSQNELAKNLKISRSSLTQIELGNRDVVLLEIQEIANTLGFSLDDFMTKDLKSIDEIIENFEHKSLESEERISVPTLQVNKFKNVVLYILEKCAGKPNVGETVLYKLLYFSDFNYYEIHEEHLTGAKYRKLPYGPVPQKLDTIINQMIDNGQLQRIKTTYHCLPQTRYLPLEKADLTLINGAEKEVIDKVIDQMSDWSAAMISNYSHGDKPWKATDNKAEINYELAFYRKAPYSVRVYDEDEENEI